MGYFLLEGNTSVKNFSFNLKAFQGWHLRIGQRHIIIKKEECDERMDLKNCRSVTILCLVSL